MAKKQPKEKPLPANSLRQQAEQMLRTAQPDIPGMSTKDSRALVNELQVHQMELESQNEELRRAKVELSESRDRYSDLYEFAPVGYLTLDQGGTIRQANLRAAKMLQVHRRDLIGRKFSNFVDPDGQDQWHLHRQAVFAETTETPEACELLLRTSHTSLWARLESTSFRSEQDAVNLCRTALIDITERKRSDEARYEAEMRLRAFLENSAVVAWMKDEAGRYVFLSENYQQRFQMWFEDVRGKTDFDLWPREFAEKLRKNDLSVLGSDGPLEFSEEVKNPDGSHSSWLSNKFPYTDSQGKKYVGGLGVDITQRIRAERALKRLNESLEQEVAERTSALSMLNDVASMANEATDVEAAILYALERVSRHNGWRFGNAWMPANENPDELLPGYAWYEEAPARFEQFRELMLGIRLRRGEGIVGRVYSSGKPEFTSDLSQHLTINKVPLSEQLGIQVAAAFPILAKEKPVGVLEFLSTKRIEATEQLLNCMASVGTLLGRVVEREQAKRELHASLERHRAVLNAASDAIVTFDGRGKIISLNPATERIFGFSSDELIGQNIELLMPSPSRKEHDGYITHFVATRQARILGMGRDLFAQRKDGSMFPIHLKINEVDHLGLFVGIIHDITSRIDLERQVVDAAVDEQRRIGQDIHDGLGQELTGLRYMAQTHAESLAAQASPETRTAERICEWLETVQGQLRSIIRELIPVEVDRHGLVAALRRLAERTTEVNDLDCRFECRPSISIADAALAAHLYRIAQEAVRNAVRHAQASHVRIQLFEDDGALTLQVTDDGVGIKSSLDESSGFGLRSMAYRARLIGATFDCRPAKEVGTQVSCTLLGVGTTANGECPTTE